ARLVRARAVAEVPGPARDRAARAVGEVHGERDLAVVAVRTEVGHRRAQARAEQYPGRAAVEAAGVVLVGAHGEVERAVAVEVAEERARDPEVVARTHDAAEAAEVGADL